jgi:hypothetical protein
MEQRANSVEAHPPAQNAGRVGQPHFQSYKRGGLPFQIKFPIWGWGLAHPFTCNSQLGLGAGPTFHRNPQLRVTRGTDGWSSGNSYESCPPSRTERGKGGATSFSEL